MPPLGCYSQSLAPESIARQLVHVFGARLSAHMAGGSERNRHRGGDNIALTDVSAGGFVLASTGMRIFAIRGFVWVFLRCWTLGGQVEEDPGAKEWWSGSMSLPTGETLP